MTAPAPPAIGEVTTWFVDAFGKGRAAHQAYRSQTDMGRVLLMTYCGRALPTPMRAPSDWPLCKSCLRSADR